MRLIILLIIFTNQAIASIKSNDPSRYMLSVDAHTNSEIDYIKFHQIVGEIYSLYVHEGVKQNRNLVLNLDWKSPYFTAWANEVDSTHYSVNFWGGIARIPGMLTETWEFITCHEIGHILGGEPRHTTSMAPWASSEGQSDHFAITECLPKYYQAFNKTEFDSSLSLPIELDKCLNSHIEIEKQNICLKILRAGRGFAEMQKYLSLSEHAANYESHAKKVTETLYNSYPTAQCRIDIFFEQSSCIGEKNCQRNSCWFAGP